MVQKTEEVNKCCWVWQNRSVFASHLRSSGALRICPSNRASKVKIRPRHITTRWDGHGPSLTAKRNKTSGEDKGQRLPTCLKAAELHLSWSSYEWCPSSLQEPCRCSRASWTDPCPTGFSQLSGEQVSPWRRAENALNTKPKKKKKECTCEHALRAEQVPVLQRVPCYNTGPLQRTSFSRRPEMLQVRPRTAKVYIQLRGDSDLQIGCV